MDLVLPAIALVLLLGGFFGQWYWRAHRAEKAAAEWTRVFDAAVAEQFNKEKARGLEYDLNQRIVATTQRLQRSGLKLPDDLPFQLRNAFKKMPCG